MASANAASSLACRADAIDCQVTAPRRLCGPDRTASCEYPLSFILVIAWSKVASGGTESIPLNADEMLPTVRPTYSPSSSSSGIGASLSLSFCGGRTKRTALSMETARKLGDVVRPWLARVSPDSLVNARAAVGIRTPPHEEIADQQLDRSARFSVPASFVEPFIAPLTVPTGSGRLTRFVGRPLRRPLEQQLTQRPEILSRLDSPCLPTVNRTGSRCCHCRSRWGRKLLPIVKGQLPGSGDGCSVSFTRSGPRVGEFVACGQKTGLE